MKTFDTARIANDWTRRSFLKTSGLAVGGFTTVPVPWKWESVRQSTNVRKNIDSLSAAELERYVQAVQELYDRSSVDGNDKTGYLYFADLHNSQNVGPCEHHWAPFFPWHRAHLWRFEKALQSVDAGLTVPYWDWSQKPSGTRYAVAFEDPATILIGDVTGFDDRNTEPHPEPPFRLDVLEETIRNSRGRWAGWAGGTTQGQPGSFESPYHDEMHSSYIGGALAVIDTAANDPLFFSFHAFIDLLWVRWQRTYQWSQPTMLDYTLRGMQNTEVETVRDVVDIQDLDYDYDDAPPVTLPPMVALASLAVASSAAAANNFPETHPDVAAAAGADEPDVIYGFDIRIPEPGFNSAEIVLADIGYSTTLSYRGYVYLHPKTVGLTPHDEAFREEYLVGFYSIWQAMAEGVRTNAVVDVSEFMGYLAVTAPGEEWKVSIVISPASTMRRLAGSLATERHTALARETSIGGFSLELRN